MHNIRFFAVLLGMAHVIPPTVTQIAWSVVTPPHAMANVVVDTVPPLSKTDSPRVSGPFSRPESVTVVPFQLYEGFILLQAEVDGHRGVFLLDTGSPRIYLNSQYVQADIHGGIDTVRTPRPTVDPDRDVILHTLRIGTLLQRLDSADVGPPMPAGPTNGKIMTDARMRQFGRPLLGFLGLPALFPFETIIDYAHQRLILVRLNEMGHPLAAVPAYTPLTTIPLVPTASHVGPYSTPPVYWGVVGRLGDILDTLSVDTGDPTNDLVDPTRHKVAAHLIPANADAIRIFKEAMDRLAHLRGDTAVYGSLWTLDHLTVGDVNFDTLPFVVGQDSDDDLGYPFLSQRGVVGFNLRTRQLTFYR